jgi:serine/threonine-protein kinase
LTTKRFAILLLKYGLLALALLLTAGVSALVAMRAVLMSQEVAVPALLGTGVSEAGATASKVGLLLRVEGRRNDARVPPDRIVAQEPVAGSRLKVHRSIRVWLSLGPRRQDVPAVEGQSLRTARLAIDEAQLSLAHVVEVDDAAQEGTVIVQRPPAGEVDNVGEGVALLVSRGRSGRDYIMPDLIGHRAEEVIAGLRRAGLKVAEVRYRSYPGLAPGIVLRQLPSAGHRVNARSSVSLDVSKATS